MRTEVNNGGFHQYFFNSAADLVTDALDAAAAARAGGLAALIRRGLKLLNVSESAGRAARQRALVGIEPEEFADLDDDYYRLESSLDLDAAMRTVMRHSGADSS